ncbi:hypothetical protein Ddye_001142 [Dipteronia dyeriana]|uniref:Uncharacterized protein n=1 Tax=Dipteronia dyeriana TaxID=168575 RepID=A0AAD9XNL4_9ROSI|nr:hypothetical protein Ddye_001142 [Dipteronia dyeriana]
MDGAMTTMENYCYDDDDEQKRRKKRTKKEKKENWVFWGLEKELEVKSQFSTQKPKSDDAARQFQDEIQRASRRQTHVPCRAPSPENVPDQTRSNQMKPQLGLGTARFGKRAWTGRISWAGTPGPSRSTPLPLFIPHNLS